MTSDREQLLDEIARCFMRAAVDELLDAKSPNSNDAEPPLAVPPPAPEQVAG